MVDCRASYLHFIPGFRQSLLFPASFVVAFVNVVEDFQKCFSIKGSTASLSVLPEKYISPDMWTSKHSVLRSLWNYFESLLLGQVI